MSKASKRKRRQQLVADRSARQLTPGRPVPDSCPACAVGHVATDAQGNEYCPICRFDERDRKSGQQP